MNSVKTKLLFLDIDGVLNMCEDTIIQSDKLKNLCDILEETKCMIVLSSAWRLETFLRQKARREITGEMKLREGYENITDKDIFLSVTPFLGALQLDNLRNNHISRTDEILFWLVTNVDFSRQLKTSHIEEFHSKWKLSEKIRLDTFVVVDDLPLTEFSCYRKRSEFKKHFVKTQSSWGFTESKKNRLIKILKSSFDAESWAIEALGVCTNPKCLLSKTTTTPSFIE
eukprot:snap_masked-scaffold_17-processed-gene-2.28-mRNA-1 protein AED:1.00 eAED:1.00 QI:0/0/0/0/1/1/3/0/226